MTKEMLVFLLFMFIGSAAFAGTDRIDVANIDKNLRLEQMKENVIQPLVTEKYEYYEIRGNNEKELRRQMSRNGTKWDDGNTYDSVTSWNVKWDYDYNCNAQGCTVDSFRTNVDITFRYPKWVRTDDSPQPLVAKWEGYMKNLITHENGHRDMAVHASAELARAATQLPPASSRTELDREVEDLTKDLMAKLNADEKEYDAATIHGTTQGAVFP